MVNYGDAIGRAWKYSLDAKRLGLLFLMFVIAAIIAISPLFLVYRSLSPSMFNFWTMLQLFGWLAAGLAIAILILLYATLLFAHNYANSPSRKSAGGKDFSLRKSSSFAISNYPRMLAVAITTGIIALVVSAVPFIGFIFSIVAGLAFFFVYQEVAFKSRFSNSIRNSYHIFWDHKLDTVITFILTAIFGVVIIVIFAIPLFAVGIASLFAAMTTGAFMQALMANLGMLIAAGLVLLVGVAFAILFTNSIKTDVYMQLKKKR